MVFLWFSHENLHFPMVNLWVTPQHGISGLQDTRTSLGRMGGSVWGSVSGRLGCRQGC